MPLPDTVEKQNHLCNRKQVCATMKEVYQGIFIVINFKCNLWRAVPTAALNLAKKIRIQYHALVYDPD